VKRLAALVPFVLVLLLVPAPAGAGGGTSVTFVNAVTYDAGTDFPLSLCIDGTLQQADVSTGSSVGPLNLASGDHLIDWVQGTDCTTGSFVSDTVTIDPNANVTVMAWWGSDGRGISVLPNDTSCLGAGLERITLRHGAATDAVDMALVPSGGASTTILTNVSVGEQATADVPNVDYDGGTITATVGGALIVGLGPSGTLPEGSAITVYLYGGNDGDIGYFVGPLAHVDTCVAPTSSSTTSTTAAVSAETRPTFTG
jgi:hypothetical protein